MSDANWDGTAIAAVFIRGAFKRMRAQTQEAIDCFASASWLGVRQNLTLLRGETKRVERLESQRSHRASSQRLRTHVDAALTALDASAMRPLGQALGQILRLTTGGLGRRLLHATSGATHERHSTRMTW